MEMPGEEPPEIVTQKERRGRRLVRRLAFALVPALFVALLGFGLIRTAGPKAVVGSKAPEFELPLLVGAGSVESRELKGDLVVVNFWASWCIPCRQEAPALERAWRDYRERGVWLLGVNILDTEEDAKDFVARFGITYPVVRDVDQEAALAFGVTGLPETFFIDHRWRFFAFEQGEQIGTRGSTVVRGAISPSDLRSRISSMIERRDSS